MTEIQWAVTLWQPWAQLVFADPAKDVENRTWPFWSTITLPVRVWIHAGQQWDTEGWHRAMGMAGRALPGYSPDRYPAGALIGSVELTGFHHAHDCEHFVGDHVTALCSRWAEYGAWHWTLADPLLLEEPIPARGHQGLWTLTEGIARQVERQIPVRHPSLFEEASDA
jgi:hypothetical protein